MEMIVGGMIPKTLCIISIFVAGQFVGLDAVLEYRYGEVLQGETVRFACELEAAGSGAWDHIPVNSDELFEVMVGRTPFSKYRDRFSISSSEHYELVIDKVQMGDAGTYICKIQSRQELSRFQLNVLESSPVCNSSSTSEYPVAENDCGLNPDTIQLKCKVRYSGVVAPVLIWENIHAGTSSSSVAGENHIVSNTTQTMAKWKVNTYKCMTKERQLSCYAVISQPFYAFNNSMKTSLKWPQMVTCQANSSHPSSYKWIHSGDVVSTNQHLDLTPESLPGEYQCLAECRFHEHTCAIQAHLISFEFASNKDRIVILALATLSTILVIVIVILLWKLYDVKHPQSYSWFHSIRQIFRTLEQGYRNGTENEMEPLLQPTILGSQSEVVDLNFSESVSVKKNIKGVTVLGNTIYIVKYASKDIDRYNSVTFKGPNPLQVPKLQEPRDLVACEKTDSLYVSDSRGCMVHKLVIRTKHISNWSTKSPPEGISVLSNANILIVFQRNHKIVEFTSNGITVRTINLPNIIPNPRHAILYQNNCYVVCFGEESDERSGVCSVDTNGKLTKDRYFDGSKSDERKMWPTRVLSIRDDLMIVLAYQHAQLLLFNAQLELKKTFKLVNGTLTSRMFLDSTSKRLFVTENIEDGKILIYNHLGIETLFQTEDEVKIHAQTDSIDSMTPSNSSEGYGTLVSINENIDTQLTRCVSMIVSND